MSSPNKITAMQTAEVLTSNNTCIKPHVVRCLPRPTNNVELLEPPYGKWEVDAVSDDGETLYLVDSCGTIICHYTQVRLLSK